MKAWQPWMGLFCASGLGVMLLGEGWVDVFGFAVAATPLAFGAYAWWRGRSSGQRTT